MGKLCPHYQMVPPWAAKYHGFQWVKCIDPPTQNLWPNTRMIGRIYIGDAREAALVAQGVPGARAYFDICRPWYLSRSYAWAWEGPNEPYVGNAQAITNLVAFTCEWARLMREAKLRTVGLNLSVGWPNTDADARLLIPAVRACDYIGLHEYNAPSMINTDMWRTLRYRRTVAAWLAGGLAAPPKLIIGECGIDAGCLTPGDRRGWRSFASRKSYKDQLQWYAEQLDQDDYIQCACVFTSGPNNDWRDFEIDEDLVAWMQSLTAFEDGLSAEAQRHVIPQNPDAAFYRYARERGWEPISGEFDYRGYRAQVWYEPAEEMQHVLYAPIDQWDNIKVVDRRN